jgi:hypothetical protein
LTNNHFRAKNGNPTYHGKVFFIVADIYWVNKWMQWLIFGELVRQTTVDQLLTFLVMC